MLIYKLLTLGVMTCAVVMTLYATQDAIKLETPRKERKVWGRLRKGLVFLYVIGVLLTLTRCATPASRMYEKEYKTFKKHHDKKSWKEQK